MAHRTSRGRANRRSKTLLSSAALVLGLGGLGALIPFTVASAAATNSFTFSGSLSGTLKLVTAADCGGSNANGTQLDDIAGKLKGSKTDQWTMTVIVPKNGTFKVKDDVAGTESATVTLETPGKNNALSWDATKGSITLHGSSGSINVTAKGVTGGASGTVKIKGSWDCPS